MDGTGEGESSIRCQDWRLRPLDQTGRAHPPAAQTTIQMAPYTLCHRRLCHRKWTGGTDLRATGKAE